MSTFSKRCQQEPDASRVHEVIRNIVRIVISQEIEESGKSFEYYDAVGPNAHEIIAGKGVKISKDGYFTYETFRVQSHFVVVATALPESGRRGKIIYQSKTGKWAGTRIFGKDYSVRLQNENHHHLLASKRKNRKKSSMQDEGKGPEFLTLLT